MTLSTRKNYIRMANFKGPDFIPCKIAISNASWIQYGEEIKKISIDYPQFFSENKNEKIERLNNKFDKKNKKYYKDEWGCVWEYGIDGLGGIVKKHPLDNWEKFEDFNVPKPFQELDIDWQEKKKDINKKKNNGEITLRSLEHGFLFMRLNYLRGFENLMYDLMEKNPKISKLTRIVTDYNKKIVNQWIKTGIDIMKFPEDLGTQSSSIISPKMFKRSIAPYYKELFQPCLKNDCIIKFHSDGYILNLIDELINCGITIINPQDLVNGIDNLKKYVKGRVAICLDIDRQKIVPYGSQKDIFELIEEEVRKLGSPDGGLELIAGIYPPTPPENIEALCKAMDKFNTYW